MGLLGVLKIAGSALTAQRLRMDVTAGNIANAEATSTPEGGPYRREQVVFTPIRLQTGAAGARPGGAFASVLAAPPGQAETVGAGVQVRSIVQDDSPPRLVYDPRHPDADEDGYVAYPDINLVTEMTDMLSASRAYEANVTVVNVAKSMAQRALEIGRL